MPDNWAEITKNEVHARTFPVVVLPPLSPARVAAVRARVRAAAKCMRDAALAISHRAESKVLEQFEFAARSVESLVDGDKVFDGDFPDPPPPSLPPLDNKGQRGVERLLYQGAAWLRMAADEMDARGIDDRVASTRQLARRLVETGQAVRDDWEHQQFLAFAAERRATTGQR